jgi:hypothetical protein
MKWQEKRRAADDTAVMRTLHDRDRPMNGREIKRAAHLSMRRTCLALTRLSEEGYLHGMYEPNSSGIPQRLYWLA